MGLNDVVKISENSETAGIEERSGIGLPMLYGYTGLLPLIEFANTSTGENTLAMPC
jgi:hypothetical protein